MSENGNGQEPREEVEERARLRAELVRLQTDVKDALKGEGPLSYFLKPPPPEPSEPLVPGVDYEPHPAINFHKAGGYSAPQGPSPHELIEQDQLRYARAQQQEALARADAQEKRAARASESRPQAPQGAPSEPQEAPGTPQPSSPGNSSNTSSTAVSESNAAPRIPRLRME